MTRRTERVGNLIQRELSDLIQKELADSRIGFVTISRVDVTADLSLARVYVSVLGSPREARSSMIGLERSASYLRTQLAKSLHMRTVPKLQFMRDKNLEHGFRMHEILSRLEEEGRPREEDGPSGEDGEDGDEREQRHA